MARNEMTEGAGINRILSNKYGVQGAPAPFMASEVFPMVVLASERPEWAYLEGSRICHVRLVDGAAVGLFGHCVLKNPADSGVILVAEHINVYRSAAGASDYDVIIGIGESGISWDTTPVGTFRDTRLITVGNTRNPTGEGGVRTQAGSFGNILESFYLNQYDNWQVDGPWVIAPDGYVGVRGGSSNNAVLCSIQWREYPATEAELLGI